MRHRSRRKPYRISFDHLESRSLLASSAMAIAQSFDSTSLGQLPQNWLQYKNSTGTGFNVLDLQAASKSAPSGSDGLGFTATASGDRGWVSPPDAFSNDVQVSLKVRPTTALLGVFARATGQNGATPSFYALEIQGGPNLQLVKYVSGARSVIKSVSGTSGDLPNDSEWVTITLAVSGGTLKGMVYRPTTGQYLTAQGGWSTIQSWALNVADTTITSGSGVGIVRDVSTAGAIYADDFTATDVAGDLTKSTVSLAAPSPSTTSLWDATTVPTVVSDPDTAAVELGLKFSSTVAGTVTGVRFYKGTMNTGTHVAHLWTSTGTLLATATFTNETASGWQKVAFSAPVTITPGVTYVVSYNAPKGRYADDDGYFTSGFSNGPLTTPANAGVFAYGSGGSVPTNTWKSSNYWVDVSFVAAASTPLASASFVTTDTTTQGNWQGTYGTDGFDLLQNPSGNNSSLPSYATVSRTDAPTGNIWNSNIWGNSSPQQPGTDASNGNASSSFSVDVHLNDGLTHRVALYAQDREGASHTETVEVIDTATGMVLDTRTLANFQRGAYLVWNLSGNISLDITSTGPASAVTTSLYFGDPVSSTVSAGPSLIANEGSLLTFQGQASGGSGMTYNWTFGDGDVASGTLTPQHLYKDNGTYTVTLFLTNGSGVVAQSSTTVTVANIAPTASANGPYTATAGQTLTLHGSATDPSPVDTAAGFTYTWDFGDGSPQLSGLGLTSPSHTYASPGTYTVLVTATDKDHATGPAASSIVTVAKPPDPPLTAFAGAPYAGQEGTPKTLTATASGGNGTYAYAWDLDNNGTFETPGQNVSTTFPDNGTYTVGLRVADTAGRTAFSSATVTVINIAPTASANGPYTVTAGQTLTLHGSATDPSSVDTAAGFTYNWDFGDGITASGLKLTDPVHTYAAPGTYSVKLTATDKDGGTSVLTSTTVTAFAPLLVSLGGPYTGNEGSTVPFSAQVTGGQAPYTYAWSFGDGTIGQGTTTPNHTYANQGSYTATLTATDAAGLTRQATANVTVNDVSPTVTLTAPSSGGVGSSVSFTASATDPSPVDQAAGFAYNWDFGDGSTGTGANPSHTYAAAGTYTISVSATAADGAKSMNVIATILVVAGSVVPIDANWLAQHGPAPYFLTQANTTYVLQTDVTTEGTAFFVLAKNVTFNLNGHTITYDQNTAPGVSNGGFENGSSPTDIPNWDVSKASGAFRAPARVGFWGNSMLTVPNIAPGTTKTILSDPIVIPKATVEYAAMIQPKVWSGSATVTVSVVDMVTGAVIASGASSDPERGTLAFVQFAPSTTHALQLRVDMQATGTTAASVDLDHADLTRSREMGIVAGSSLYIPNYLGSNPIVNDSYPMVANVKIINGTVTQGTGRSYGGIPIYVRGTPGVTLDHLTLAENGPSTEIIHGYHATNVSVTNCNLTGGMDLIDERTRAYAAIDFRNDSSDPASTIYVANNTIRGSVQNGIAVGGPNVTSARILYNDIRVNASWTDSYGISASSPNSFEVGYNTIIPINGRGMYFDGVGNVTANGNIHDNYVEARERPNLEFNAMGIEATALRIRSGTLRNLVFTNNTFAAYTGPGLAWAAIGARIGEHNANHQNDNSNNLFLNNTFKAIVMSPDPTLTGVYAGSQAWGMSLSRVDPGTGLTFKGNTFESNVTPLNAGDSDSYGPLAEYGGGTNNSLEQDVTFISNTIKMNTTEGASPNSAGLRPFTSIALGDWSSNVHNIRFIDMAYTNGAPTGVTSLNSTPGAVDWSTGFLVNLKVTNPDGTPVNGASFVLFDKNNQQVYAGVTDATGSAVNIPLITTVVSATAGNPQTIVTDPRGPFSLVVTSGTKKKTVGMNVASDLTWSVTLD